MVVMGVVQSLMALSTASPTLSETFGVLVSLAVVTNVIPYIIALSALPLMMRTAGVEQGKYRLNVAVAVVAMLYSTYAIFASGKDAVMGGTLVMAIGFIIWGFIAHRFAAHEARRGNGLRDQTSRRRTMRARQTAMQRDRAASRRRPAASGQAAKKTAPPGRRRPRPARWNGSSRAGASSWGIAPTRAPSPSRTPRASPAGYSVDLCRAIG